MPSFDKKAVIKLLRKVNLHVDTYEQDWTLYLCMSKSDHLLDSRHTIAPGLKLQFVFESHGCSCMYCFHHSNLMRCSQPIFTRECRVCFVNDSFLNILGPPRLWGPKLYRFTSHINLLLVVMKFSFLNTTLVSIQSPITKQIFIPRFTPKTCCQYSGPCYLNYIMLVKVSGSYENDVSHIWKTAV
jgi:hypothetical protein